METPQEETTEPVPENDSEQYPEEDIPEEEEDDDEEDEDEDPDDGDYKVSPVRISIRFMKDDHEFLFKWVILMCFISRALLQHRLKNRRMTMMRGLCRPTTIKRRTSLMVSVCIKCLYRVTQPVLSYEWVMRQNTRSKAQMCLHTYQFEF